MKKSTFSIAIIAMFGLLVVGCHDEPVNTEGPTPSPTMRNVAYVACGEPQRATVTGDDEWHTLLNSLFDAVDNGCAVTFWNPDAPGAKTTDTVTISTPDRQQAYTWGEEMYDQGYTVTIIFDSTGGVYNGTAVMQITTAQDYEPIPLERYLPGTWVIDGTVLARFAESEDYPEGHWCYEYGYDYNYNDSLIFTDSTVYTTVMGGSTGPYVILDSNTIQMQLPLYQEWWFYEFSERSIIYQLDENRMLIHGYLPNESFLGYIQDSPDNFTYLFIRQ